MNKIAIVSSYLPRKCGIAIFTNDFCTNMEHIGRKSFNIDIIAINDGLENYQYSSKIKFEISSDISDDYLKAAAYLNKIGYDAVILQHEFGLFGGKCGEYVLNFTENIQAPLFIVLHSVLKQPGSEQKRIIQKLGQNSHRLIVMNPMACKMLEDIYLINPDHVKMIHHGVTDIPHKSIQRSKDALKFKGKKILMSYGLIGPGKGFEYVIDALPTVVNRHPDVIYIIAGALHPHIYKHQGDIYLKQLKDKIHEHKLDQHVLMYNHYLKTDELHNLFNATDIFITPYLSQEQITSGTMALAMACGKPIVSTPTWYAQEILSESRGVIVPFRDSQAISREVIMLLNSPDKRLAMANSNYEYSRQMLWEKVCNEYLVMLNADYKPHIVTGINGSNNFADSRFENLPQIKLLHLKALTDKTGIIQHSLFSVPDKQSGYCVDDAARALLVANQYYKLYHDASILQDIKYYFNFLKQSFNRKTMCFRNMLNIEVGWDGEDGSGDSQGRALWGLSTLIKDPPTEMLFFQAKELFLQSLTTSNEFVYPRSISFSILGMYEYLKAFPDDKLISGLLEKATYKLLDLYKNNRHDSWLWFEDKLTYDNAKLPHALLIGSHYLNRPDIFAEAKQSLKWLINIQTEPKGYLSVIGNKNYSMHNKPIYYFDQQPLEAMALVHACADCYRLTGDSEWRDHASFCFRWFLGENYIQQPMFNEDTGAGYDGFNETERNENQGAEATISWLFSWLEIFDIFKK